MNLAFREKRHFNFALMKRCAYAAFNAGVGEKARADARIILEGIKNSTTQTRTKGSNYVVWQKQVNQGTSQETLVLPSFTGPNNPTFTAPGGLSVQIAEGDFRSQINTLSAQPGMGCHKSFMVSCPLALLGSAFYAVLVHRLAIYAPRFLPTLSRPHAVALHFAHCDQLAAGLAPAGVRPCWAHKAKILARPGGIARICKAARARHRAPSGGPHRGTRFI